MAARKKKVHRRRITRRSLIKDVITLYPETVKIFEKHKIPCLGCHSATLESVESTARRHKKNSQDIARLVKELNAHIDKER